MKKLLAFVCSCVGAGAMLLASTAGAAPRRPAPPPPSTQPEKNFPSDVVWHLVTINGKRGPAVATLLIDTTMRGSGFAGCNTWSATLWTARAQRLLMGPPALTRKMCAPAVMAFEHAFLVGIAAQATWDLVRDELVVKSRGGTLVFSRSI